MRLTTKDQAPQRASAQLSLTAQADASMHCVTEDIDEFRATLNSVFYPAHVDLVDGRNRVCCAELSAARLKYLTIGLARPGTEVCVDPGDLGTYHVNVPVSGEVVSWCGEQQMVATAQRAAVFTPHRRHSALVSIAPPPPRSTHLR